MKGFWGRHLAAVLIVLLVLIAMAWPAWHQWAWAGRYVLGFLGIVACCVLVGAAIGARLVPNEETHDHADSDTL